MIPFNDILEIQNYRDINYICVSQGLGLGRRLTTQGPKGTLWSHRNVIYLDSSGGDMVYICKKIKIKMNILICHVYKCVYLCICSNYLKIFLHIISRYILTHLGE